MRVRKNVCFWALTNTHTLTHTYVPMHTHWYYVEHMHIVSWKCFVSSFNMSFVSLMFFYVPHFSNIFFRSFDFMQNRPYVSMLSVVPPHWFISMWSQWKWNERNKNAKKNRLRNSNAQLYCTKKEENAHINVAFQSHLLNDTSAAMTIKHTHGRVFGTKKMAKLHIKRLVLCSCTMKPCEQGKKWCSKSKRNQLKIE